MHCRFRFNYQEGNNWDPFIMKRKFKQWWSSALPPIWTKWTLTSHLKLLIIEKTTTYGVGNPCGGAKCVKGIPIIPLLIIKSKTTMHIFLCRMSNTNMCNIFKDIGCFHHMDSQLHMSSSFLWSGECSFCSYWWKCWSSLFKLSFHNIKISQDIPCHPCSGHFVLICF
jgi:hypothetical protein